MLYRIGKIIIATVAWLDMLGITGLLYLFSFFPKKVIDKGYPYLFQKWCWAFIRALGVELKLHQKNRHPLPAHYIVIANHPSVFEDIGMSALFPAHYLAKQEIKEWWILGRISLAAGTLYVQRDSTESRKQAREMLIAALQQGKNIGLYPEGGCKGRRIALPFQQGAFNAAIQTKTAIIPVFLHYEAQEVFEWLPGESLILKLWKIANSSNKTAHYFVYDAIDPTLFLDQASLRIHVERLYLQWQAEYLE